ncbi:MAG: hypothetical protein WC379_14545 [Methanoregula sp.]|jgi:hypothetical protein
MNRKDLSDLTDDVREQIIPVTVAVVFLAFAAFTFGKMQPAFTPEGIIMWVLILIAVMVMFGWFPALPLLYGWYSGNRAGAILAGILPLPLFFIAGFFLLRLDNMVFVPQDLVSFVGILSAILGVAGYCAAQRTKEYLAVSVVLAGLWLVFFMSGID